jgi:hypothetical protein
MDVAGSSWCQTLTDCLRGLGPFARSYNRAMHRSTEVVLGPLATVGGALLGLALLRRSWKLAAAGAAALVADQRLPAGQRLKEAIRKNTPNG